MTHFIGRKFTAPSSVTVVTGGTPVGTASDMQTLLDGNVYQLPEVTGTPGFDLEINFTDVPRVKGIVFRGYYSGSTTHYVELQIRNYNTSTDDTIIRIDTAATYNYRTILIPNDTDFINSSNQSQLTFYHPMSGNAAHDLYLDFVSLVS